MVSIRFAAAALVVAAGASVSMAELLAPTPVRATSISISNQSEFGNRGVTPLLYSATAQTGSRFNPGVGGNPSGSGVQQNVSFDDVPITNPGNLPQVEITQITYGIRRIGGATAPQLPVDINFFATTLTTNAPDGLGNAIDLPLTSIGSASLPGGATASTTDIVTLNFAVPLVLNLNNTFFNPTGGIGAIALGLQFAGANAGNIANGWRLTNPDAGFVNANQLFWMYDTDQAAPADRGAFSFGVPSATVPPSTFFLTVTGNLVPAPGAFALLGLGGLVATRRRR